MSWWRDRDDNYPRFPKSRPREAKGGIKSRSKGGNFGQSWWAKRWNAVLEGFDIGARLGRGRSYARSGQVLAIHVGKGEVRAKVQGSRPEPYEIAIQVKQLPLASWKRLAQTLSQQAIFAAKLLAGEMPPDIEDAFKQADLSLFPDRLGDMSTKCSCPDWSNPCKHIAAVYYLLGEEFDRDPFLIFLLRGTTREELLDLMEDTGEAGPSRSLAPAYQPPPPPEPLAAEPSRFWGGGSLPENWLGTVVPTGAPASLARRLGGFPFWSGEQEFSKALEPVYSRASARGLNAMLGTQSPGPTKE